MWTDHENTESDEQQDSIQQLENRLRSGGLVFPILLNEQMGFSQTLSRVRQVVISYGKNQISPGLGYADVITKTQIIQKLELSGQSIALPKLNVY